MTGAARRALPSAKNSMAWPFSMMKTFSGATPVSTARRPCWTSIRNSPCIGMKYLGLVRPSISLSSSWLAWPETWACLTVW